MKMLIIGGNGTIGKKVVEYFLEKNDVIVGGRTSGDVIVDISNSDSIRTMFKQVGRVDAIICIGGEAKWGSFDDLLEEDYHIGIQSKLMGQVNLVRIGRDYLTQQGSITLSTGILADRPVIKTASAAMVNGAIHSFVKAVDLEIGHQVRINVACLGLVEDSYERYKSYFPGHNPISMTKAVNAYVQAVEGHLRGSIIRVYN